MALTINFHENFRQLGRSFGRMMERAVVNSTRRSLAKTIVTYRKLVDERIREKIPLKSSEVKKEFLDIRKNLRGSKLSHLRNMEATVRLADKPVSFIRLVRGSRKPEQQRGKRISRRRKLRIELPTGHVKQDRSLFIARARGGAHHVFRRVGKAMKKQAAPSPHHMFIRSEERKALEQPVGEQLQKNFIREMDFELSKEKLS